MTSTPLTNSQIKKKALERLKGKWGTTISFSVFKSAFLLIFVTVELLLYVIFRHIGIEYSFYPSFLLGTGLGRFMLSVRILLLLFLFTPEYYILRRLMIDIYEGNNFVETRRYIQYNSRKIHPKSTLASVLPTMLKFFAAIPLLIGAAGIYYFGFKHSGDTLTTVDLFLFMLSIGFSIVWTGVFIHYCISLTMTKYIMSLNPRANVFDACDLSVKLMDGNHGRYLSLLLSFAKYIPLLLLIYPYFVFEPYFKMTFIAFAEDVMRSYWQDKYPAMIKRWNKYAR